MNNDIKEVLYNEDQLRDKVRQMGAKISNDYSGKELILIGVLKGSVVFMADLIRQITIPCKMDFMAVSSYGNSTETSGVVKILKDLDYDIQGKDVLIVEDIIDSGVTLKYLRKYLLARKPSSLEIICMLNKPDRRTVDIDVKYLGYNVPDYFLVGFGLDFAQKYRNLPYVGILKEEIYK
ncbi:hypoxanthine phosphoribosyltransferase [Clostridium sp.]|uniref:hypoxanthine phosphoribosyltransferase n=1 Tax=Clostridium sp. TaxID=1506 RepID=UPI001A388570|nr:hypoxanthine phosphoribosyltransferase [Clostridium sp.]MBK5239751.1 hypoxanthine phosphoribosyltransferase [Clostridium sp.]